MSNPILIAVPPHLVQAVATLIANDGEEVADPASAEPVGEQLINGWTEEALRLHYRESSPKMRKFLVHLAEHADAEVTTHDAAKAVGYQDWSGIAGMLGAAGHRASNRYGLKYGPWDRRYDENDQTHMTMPGAAAAIVLDEAGK